MRQYTDHSTTHEGDPSPSDKIETYRYTQPLASTRSPERTTPDRLDQHPEHASRRTHEKPPSATTRYIHTTIGIGGH
jgi:hypothetical protein